MKKGSIGCVSFLLFAQGLALEWPFLSARSPTPEPEPQPNFKYGACSNNGALVCNGPDLFGTCNYGSVVYQSVAEGTVCEDGKIVRKDDETESCQTNGALICYGSRMYGMCESGKVVYQPATEGTWCEDGTIFTTGDAPKKEEPQQYYSGVPHSVIPHSTIPHSTIPHSTIPHSMIPTSYATPTAKAKRFDA